ncbi:MAG: glycoside hydrolase [Blastocatellia bacterium]|nr:glycoside hydrolase [Blastocatellia bacterium]
MKRFIVVIALMIALTLLVGISPRFTGANSQKFIQGPEVLASANQDGGDLRCEPSAAIFKDTILVAWNDSYGGRNGSSTGTAVGWSISRDRGKTFQFGGYLPLAQKDFVPAAADSRLAVDREGNFFLEILSWQEKSHHIQLYSMEKNNPGKWRKLPDPVVYDRSKGEEYLDKPAMSVSDSRVSIVYTEKRQSSGATISFILSKDRGKTWSKPVRLSADSNRVRTGSAVIINDNEIMAAWTEGDSEIWFARSRDGGKSFSVATQAYRLKRPFTPPKAYRMALGQMANISNDISLASVNNPSGGALYYFSFVEGTEKGSDVLLVSYDAKTEKWSAPIPLSKGEAGAVKIFPSMAIIGRSPALLYYKRNDASSTITDVYLSILSEGEHFESLKLNTVSSDWATTKGDKKYAPIQRIFGDYITLASDGNILVAAWTDGREGAPRIYARVIEIR